MKMLLIGGTVFLGRHLIDASIERGHEVTLFNRGRHNADLYPDIEKLRGDRSGDLSVLKGREWDAVIDTCGYVPSDVRRSAEALADATEHYTFISSISVYAEFGPAGTDENAAVATMTNEQLAEAEAIDPGERATAVSYGEFYGPLKIRCEQEAEKAMPGRILNVRPGLIVGPHDYTDRFTYWVHRVAQGGEVLAPGRPDRPLRFIDVRDLAEWMIRMAEVKGVGAYNAAGAPGDRLTMASLLETCRDVTQSDATFTWASEELLLEQEVGPWVELPLWLHEARNSIFAVNNDEAVAAGLTFRPVADTVRATFEWDRSRPSTEQLRAGLKPDRERQLLDELHR